VNETDLDQAKLQVKKRKERNGRGGRATKKWIETIDK
jgi:hypothetical protein